MWGSTHIRPAQNYNKESWRQRCAYNTRPNLQQRAAASATHVQNQKKRQRETTDRTKCAQYPLPTRRRVAAAIRRFHIPGRAGTADQEYEPSTVDCQPQCNALTTQGDFAPSATRAPGLAAAPGRTGPVENACRGPVALGPGPRFARPPRSRSGLSVTGPAAL